MDLNEINTEIVACRRCPRLVAWREEVARVKRKAYQDRVYWGKPVPGFGDPEARILIVGLAPGAHGSNRTGRVFTGDASGGFMYPALHRAGFATETVSLQWLGARWRAAHGEAGIGAGDRLRAGVALTVSKRAYAGIPALRVRRLRWQAAPGGARSPLARR